MLFSLVTHIHWVPVLAVTAFSFILGFLWHSPLLFGKTWLKEINPDGKPRPMNPLMIFGGSGILHFVMTAGLSAVLSGLGLLNGLLIGLTVSLVFVVPAMAVTYLFSSRSLKLFAIDAGFYVFYFGFAGLVLGIW